MSDDDDNVIPFGPRYEIILEDDELLPADDVLEEAMGVFDKVVICGINIDGEMEVFGNIPDLADVYDTLQSSATHIAMSVLSLGDAEGEC